MKIILNDIEYKLIDNYRECFNKEEIQEKLKDVDYFNSYDYILGDYSYDKLRLKGFYNKNNKSVNSTNNYDSIKQYISDYCSYGCKYFILERVSK